MTPPAEGQEKDVLLVLDKQQGKVSAVKGFDKEGNLQTVPPIQGGEFMQVDKNGDIISNLVANFYRKFQDTEGLALFRCKASEVEQNAKAIEDNHRNPTPEGDRRVEGRRKHSVYRNRTTRNPSRATASTRRRLTGRA